MALRQYFKINTRRVFLVTSIIFTLVCFLSLWSDIIEARPGRQMHNKSMDIKYVLQWTSNETIPFNRMGVGQENFVMRNCPKQNCFITKNRHYFGDVKMFDAILFHGPEISNTYWWLPFTRSPEQKYVFVSLESSHYYPIIKRYNNFFNWTWTYKLDSDLPYKYLIVRDKAMNIIGPNKTMHWMNIRDMKPIDENVKKKLSNKNKTAAWFVSNCNALSKRSYIAGNLTLELKKYNLSVDIYGKCGNFKCPTDTMKNCLEKIKRSYYFYLAFENSFSVDYVTEKLLNSLQNYAIPIVYGRANYTRFMPNGIYLQATESNAPKLAKKMYDIINDKELYYSYFKWHNHYSYHDPDEAPDSDEYCNFCATLNDKKAMTQVTTYENFIKWWER